MRLRQLFTSLLLLNSLLSAAQSFEGTLTYVADFEVADKLLKMGMTKKMMLDKMKEEGNWSDTIQVSYKGGNYYTLNKSNTKSWVIYNADSSKLYMMQEGEAADLCFVTDATIDLEAKMTGKMPTITLLDTTVASNGISSKIVRVKWASGTHDYYFDPERFNVNPTLFAAHVYDGWSGFLALSKALPIKIVKTVKGLMTATMTLVASDNNPVSEKLFAVPKLIADKELNIVKLPNKELMRILK